MGKPIGPKKVHRYSNEFKVQAVRLSLHPEIPTQDVATALDIHPFMLSRWKKDWRGRTTQSQWRSTTTGFAATSRAGRETQCTKQARARIGAQG